MAVNIKKGSVIGVLTITPLIDIVFLLLIFFLVATRFAEEDRAEGDLHQHRSGRPLLHPPKADER